MKIWTGRYGQVRAGLELNWKGIELEGQVGPCTGGLKGRITGSRVVGEKVGGTDWYTGNWVVWLVENVGRQVYLVHEHV